MTRAEFGTYTELHKKAFIDIEILIKTRLLVQANSGGGKSYLLRKLMELLFGKVQQIIFDVEGEFSTLREKYAFVRAASDGPREADVDPNTADVLCKKILELGSSIIIDLYELDPKDRKKYIRVFLDAMIDAPRDLWHPVVVYLDEVHEICPEKGHGESEAEGAVIRMLTKGRKRGYAAICATQRLSKFNKDAAAEARNVMIGNTTLDTDQKRASDVLGFTSREQTLSLRDLESGTFYVFGPAFIKGVNLVKVGSVVSHHPSAGETNVEYAPARPEEVKAILEQLSDIPQVKKRELKEREDFISTIREQRAEIQSKDMRIHHLENSQNTISPEKVKEIQETAYTRGTSAGAKALATQITPLQARLEKQTRLFKTLADAAKTISDTAAREAGLEPIEVKLPEMKMPELPKTYQTGSNYARVPTAPQKTLDPSTSYAARSQREHDQNFENDEDKSSKLKAGALRMLKALAQFYPKPLLKAQVAALSDMTVGAGAWQEYEGKLEKQGLVLDHGTSFEITREGLDRVGDVPPLNTDPNYLVEMWASRFKAGVGRMLKYVASKYPDWVPMDEVATAATMTRGAGAWQEYIGKLKSNNLIEVQGNEMRASPFLYLQDELALTVR